MIGLVFGFLTVVERAPATDNRARWFCLCKCGKKTSVSGTNLRSGKTKSCGCLRALSLRSIATVHGGSKHPLYTRWLLMHARCYDPENNRYYRYGARGIKVCRRWHSFRAYLSDVALGFKPGLTLDRVDNNKDYGPKNFRWATYSQQARNKSTSVLSEADILAIQKLYLEGGVTQAEVGKKFGVSRDTVKHCLRNLRA